ncbi:hypothetical protein [Nonomuraea dietziae]|uniref:hypothetical protein n=1 Tax=Nonomuraea dietziae TaxID=65515 RepID=UPI00343709EC
MLLTWLSARSTAITALSQAHLDAWLVDHPARSPHLAAFIKWTNGRALTAQLTVPARPRGRMTTFLEQDEHLAQLRHFLTTSGIPTNVRAASCLVLLFGTPSVFPVASALIKPTRQPPRM